jgi:hypothetical protein
MCDLFNCRYNLLLQQLVKYTWKDHIDYPRLELAFEKMTEVANYVNEVKLDQSMSLIFQEKERIRKCHQSQGDPGSFRWKSEGPNGCSLLNYLRIW